MKKVTIFLLILFTTAFMLTLISFLKGLETTEQSTAAYTCKSKEKTSLLSKEEFHVRITPTYVLDEKEYYVEFTNDNWETKENIMQLSDFTPYKNVEWINTIYCSFYSDKRAAVLLANKFKTYEECVGYNDRLKSKHDALVVKYKKQGIPTFSEYLEKEKYEEKKKLEAEKPILIR